MPTARRPTRGPAAPPRIRLLPIASILVATAAAVALPSGGSAYWLCVPAALLAAARGRSVAGGVLGAAAVIATAFGALALRHRPMPSPVEAAIVPLSAVAILTTLRQRLERERDAMQDVAMTDPLTGVANRRSLLGRADYEIARHRRERRSFAVVMIDLDGFKQFNDRFGHAAGDEILCDVADALRSALRAQDTLARLGGDEFCVLAPLTGDAQTEGLSERINAGLRGATSGVATISASLGVAVFPRDGRSASELLEAADRRLLAAKRGRRSGSGRRAA